MIPESKQISKLRQFLQIYGFNFTIFSLMQFCVHFWQLYDVIPCQTKNLIVSLLQIWGTQQLLNYICINKVSFYYYCHYNKVVSNNWFYHKKLRYTILEKITKVKLIQSKLYCKKGEIYKKHVFCKKKRCVLRPNLGYKVVSNNFFH